MNDNMNIQKIQLKQIHLSSFNPPTRTTASALRGLKEEIEKIGIRAPIHVIPIQTGKETKYILVDGHRRVSIALELGWKTINAVVHSVSDNPVTLWASLNSRTRSVSAFEWMVAWHLTGHKMPVSPAVKGMITQCVQVFGRDGIPFLIEHKASPTVGQTVNRLYDTLESKGLTDKTRKQVGMWLVKHKLQKSVNTILLMKKDKKTLSKMSTRIDRDEPFDPIELVAVRAVA